MYYLKVDGKTVHGPGNDKTLVSNPVLNTSIDNNGALTFDVPPTNNLYEEIIPMKSIATVYSGTDEIWRGRVLDMGSDFDLLMPVVCEGLIGFLNDTYLRPSDDVDPDWSISQYIGFILSRHNAQCSTGAEIYKGNITMTYPDGHEPDWGITDYQTVKTALDTVKTTYGGYFDVRVVSGKYYLDYFKEYPLEVTQDIIFSKNLLDLVKTIQGDTLKTAIIPLGATDGDERITIESVNPTGKDYITSADLVNKYGLIYSTVDYPEIEDEQELYDQAVEDFPTLTEFTTLTATAVDLNLIDKDVRAFRVGDMVRVQSPPHGIDKTMQVTEVSLDMGYPDNSTVTLGNSLYTISGELVSFDSFDSNALEAEIAEKETKISQADLDEISNNLGGIPDMSLANALKKMTEAVDVPLTWESGWGGTYTCKAYPAQRICRLTGTVATGHPVLEPSTYVTVANIPSAYLPTEVYALTASGGTQFVEGAVTNLGVRLRAKGGNWTAGYVGYFSGWWYY